MRMIFLEELSQTTTTKRPRSSKRRVTASQDTSRTELKKKCLKEIYYFLGIDPNHKKEYRQELEGGKPRCGVRKAGSWLC